MPEDTIVALCISNVRAGSDSPINALYTLANAGFYFVGGIEEKEEHIPRYKQFHLDLNIGEWVYNTEKGQDSTVTITDIGGIAILAGLFGNLDNIDERLICGERLTKKHPPYFGWREKPQLARSWPGFDYYARPELITKAQREPENVTGAIHIVRPAADDFEPIGQGIYNSFVTLPTLGILRLTGTALFNINVEPDNFDDISSSSYYLEPKDKRG